MDTVGTIAAMHEGKVKVFVGMGGNFALAAPDTPTPPGDSPSAP